MNLFLESLSRRFAFMFVLSAALLCSCGPLVSDPDAAPKNIPRGGVDEANFSAKPLRAPIRIGEPIPRYTWKDQKGISVSTTELVTSGDAILVFHPGDDSPATRPVYEWVRSHRDKLQQKACEIVLVTEDAQQRNASVAAREELHAAVLEDPAGYGARAFGLLESAETTRPAGVWTVIIAREGRVIGVKPGLMDFSEVMMAVSVRPTEPPKEW